MTCLEVELHLGTNKIKPEQNESKSFYKEKN